MLLGHLCICMSDYVGGSTDGSGPFECNGRTPTRCTSGLAPNNAAALTDAPVWTVVGWGAMVAAMAALELAYFFIKPSFLACARHVLFSALCRSSLFSSSMTDSWCCLARRSFLLPLDRDVSLLLQRITSCRTSPRLFWIFCVELAWGAAPLSRRISRIPAAACNTSGGCE